MKYSKKRILNISIPDEDYSGVLDTIKVHRNLTITSVAVHVNVEHAEPSELAVELTCPQGETLTLDGPGKDTGKNLDKSYSGELLEAFVGKKSAGKWSLRVIDTSKADVGILKNWTLVLETKNSKKTEIFNTPDTQLSSAQICHEDNPISNLVLDVTMSDTIAANSKLTLESPKGTVVNLPVQNNKSAASYSKELEVVNGESPKGKWILKLQSNSNVTLKSWKLRIGTTQHIPLMIDDLTKIEGVGPKIQGLLKSGGIRSFKQLAEANYDTIKSILDAAGSRYQMHDPTSWPKQSQLAADGHWEELKVLQDELDGGR